MTLFVVGTLFVGLRVGLRLVANYIRKHGLHLDNPIHPDDPIHVHPGSSGIRSSSIPSESDPGTSHFKPTYVPGSDGTYAQNYQDVFVANLAKANGWDDDDQGFFLDLGAFHGLECSNTAKAEKELGWRGICVEPRPAVGAFRDRNCLLVKRPLFEQSGRTVWLEGSIGSQVQVVRVVEDGSTSEDVVVGDHDQVASTTLSVGDLLSCVNGTRDDSVVFDGEAIGSPRRRKNVCTGVPSGFAVPNFINFVSLDVEGGERAILRSFPFETVTVGVWVIEVRSAGDSVVRYDHGVEIEEILTPHGYRMISVENAGVDAYYVHEGVRVVDVRKDFREHPEGSNGC